MNTIQTIKTRKSPEVFNAKEISASDLKAIVEAGNYAPIFGKVQFTVVTDAELLDTINEIAMNMMKHSGNEFLEKTASIPGYHAVRHATAFVILSAPGGNEPMGFNMANVSCAAENIQLAATELGVGSRFMMGPIMALTQEPVKSKLALPEDYQPLVAVALGYVDGEFSERTKEMDNIKYI